MEMSKGQNGIQQLLAAEQEAQHIVEIARNAKMARLKQDKEEAEEKTAAKFHAQVEYNFRRYLDQSDAFLFGARVLSQLSLYSFALSLVSFAFIMSSGDLGANVKRLEVETDAKINPLKNEAARISHDVIHMLLKH
ncbi:hypothetical protein PTKIN_Ptkin06aG0100900 [Pterospermum kingtungense]